MYVKMNLKHCLFATGAHPAPNLTGSNCNPKKFGSPESGEKNILGLLALEGSGGMLPQKILKI